MPCRLNIEDEEVVEQLTPAFVESRTPVGELAGASSGVCSLLEQVECQSVEFVGSLYELTFAGPMTERPFVELGLALPQIPCSRGQCFIAISQRAW